MTHNHIVKHMKERESQTGTEKQKNRSTGGKRSRGRERGAV